MNKKSSKFKDLHEKYTHYKIKDISMGWVFLYEDEADGKMKLAVKAANSYTKEGTFFLLSGRAHTTAGEGYLSDIGYPLFPITKLTKKILDKLE